ncbi:MAG: hypothetical protein ACJA1C_002212 [Crocinitomicaceae bacterium]|jgi:hypothetical protein
MKILEEKVLEYLKKRGTIVVKKKVKYGGIEKDLKSRNGDKSDKHLFAFLIPSEGEDLLCFIHVDVETEKLERFIPPHFTEWIVE